jgi:hypothetical protein
MKKVRFQNRHKWHIIGQLVVAAMESAANPASGMAHHRTPIAKPARPARLCALQSKKGVANATPILGLPGRTRHQPAATG